MCSCVSVSFSYRSIVDGGGRSRHTNKPRAGRVGAEAEGRMRTCGAPGSASAVTAMPTPATWKPDLMRSSARRPPVTEAKGRSRDLP
eukprot:898374-Prymnesium_polylepis.2